MLLDTYKQVNQGDVAHHEKVYRATINKCWVRYNNTGK